MEEKLYWIIKTLRISTDGNVNATFTPDESAFILSKIDPDYVDPSEPVIYHIDGHQVSREVYFGEDKPE